MQKTIGMLAVVLVAQLLLAVALGLSGPSLEAVPPDTPLFELDDQRLDRLTIEESGSEPLVLTRRDQGWVLPGAADFPADQGKVDRLIGKLKGLRRGLAVATSSAALPRFKVSDDDYERRVVLAAGDEPLATLYFGTSPGVRRVHARSNEDDAVYAVDFGVHDASLKLDDWLDTTVLQMPVDDIEKIGLAGLTLSRQAGGTEDVPAQLGDGQKPIPSEWSIAELSEAETVNQANADELAEKLATLRIGSVLGAEVKPAYGLEDPELRVTLQRKGGAQLDYELGKRDKEKDYVLKVSNRAEYFRLPAYTGDALIKAAGREQLVMAAATVDEDAADDAEPVVDGGSDAP